jgi:hypothetical protein
MLCVVCVVIRMVVGANIHNNASHFFPKKKTQIHICFDKYIVFFIMHMHILFIKKMPIDILM